MGGPDGFHAELQEVSDRVCSLEEDQFEMHNWRRQVDSRLANVVTREELRTVTDAQTEALVASINSIADRIAHNPTVRKLGLALAGLAFVAINAAVAYLTRGGQ